MNMLLQCTSRVQPGSPLFSKSFPGVVCVQRAALSPIKYQPESPTLWLTCAYPAVCLQSLINLNFGGLCLPGYFRGSSGCFCFFAARSATRTPPRGRHIPRQCGIRPASTTPTTLITGTSATALAQPWRREPAQQAAANLRVINKKWIAP
jgi:hypothetical protein